MDNFWVLIGGVAYGLLLLTLGLRLWDSTHDGAS
jgi:hypothetical protein